MAAAISKTKETASRPTSRVLPAKGSNGSGSERESGIRRGSKSLCKVLKANVKMQRRKLQRKNAVFLLNLDVCLL
jgi:hypothetical protein